MRCRSSFHNHILRALSMVIAVALQVALAFVPVLAQNAVPPTAREAAALPAFASRLARHAPPQAAGKPRTPASGRARPPSPQDSVVAYENGPVNGTTDAWVINFGYVISDTFTLTSAFTITGFDFYTWELPGDSLLSLDWSITDVENGACPSDNCLGNGTASGNMVTDTYISTNQYGYNIDKISVSGLYVGLSSGTVWLNLQNATVPRGDPVYWDENSGAGCNSPGCPSQASDSALGTIPSEAFDVVAGSSVSICDSGGDAPSSQSAQNFQVIYNFTGGADGAFPNAATLDPHGNIYGTTSGFCPDCNSDTAFRLSQHGSGWVLNPLFQFSGNVAARSIGPDGGLYGAAACNGISCLVELKPSPVAPHAVFQPWDATVLSPLDTPFYNPVADVVFDQTGNIYGSVAGGGAFGFGEIYELTPSGNSWTKTALYTFQGGADGQGPSPLIIDKSGNLYGTTWGGGESGGGTIFELSYAGPGWTKKTLYSIQGMDGGRPQGTALAMDNLGNLYGATGPGYTNSIFSLTPGNEGWTFNRIWMVGVYDGVTDRLIVDAAGNLYGGTPNGCAGDRGKPHGACDLAFYWGEVFRLSPLNGGWQCTQLHAFNGNDGYDPMNLSLDANGVLYGTTAAGGTGPCEGKFHNGCGVIWQITP